MSRDPEATPEASAPRRALAIAKFAFTPVAIGFLLWFAWISRDTLAGVVANSSASRLAAAVGVWCVIQTLVPLLASVVLDACGARVGWRWALRSHAARLPARYVPGGIWHTVGRVADLRAHGVAARPLAAFVLLENGLAACVTFTLGGLVLLAFGRPAPWPQIAGLGVIAGLVGVIALAAIVDRRVLGAGGRYRAIVHLRAITIAVLFWLGAALSFVLYLSAFPGTLAGGGALVEAAGVYLFAWAIGFVSVFAPQGIGIFELVAGDLLTVPLALASTAVLVAGFRGVILAADVVVWSIVRAAFARIPADEPAT